jgi:hypothetical protein
MSDYDDHVALLYEHCKPNLDGLPTPDEVLSGKSCLPSNVTYDQVYLLSSLVIKEMINIWKKYGSKHNILTEDKLDNLLKYFSNQKEELQIFFIEQLKDVGIQIEQNHS